MIASAVAVGLALLAAALLLPCAVLASEVAMAWRARDLLARRSASTEGRRPSVAVLVPAHNEALGIAATLRSVRSQLDARDELLVVADNCSDDTVDVARREGARVVERVDPQRRGKGYALDHGLRQLNAGSHEVIVMVDADCELEDGCIDLLAKQVQASGRPVQARYLMKAEADSGPGRRLAEFAWRLKNAIRPLGAQAMGWPCLLTGSGMAFPRASLGGVPLASGNIVEDMQLGLDLALRGVPPCFAPAAVVSSRFASGDGARSQRARWEHGHLATLLSQAPRLLAAGVRHRRPALLGLALDLAVPPLALLALLVAAAWIAAAAGWLIVGTVVALGFASLAALLLASAVLIAWRWQGRDLLTGREWLQVPAYALAKLPLYLRFVRGRQSTWVRAKRDGE